MGGPGFGGGQRGAPNGQDLRALVDAFETFFGFRDRFNWGNPELLSARSVQSYANALPAVFHAERRARNAPAEAQILRSGRRLKKPVGLRGRKEIQHRFDPNRSDPIDDGG